MSGNKALKSFKRPIFTKDEAPEWFQANLGFENRMITAARMLLWHERATFKERMHYAMTGEIEYLPRNGDPEQFYSRSPYRDPVYDALEIEDD